MSNTIYIYCRRENKKIFYQTCDYCQTYCQIFSHRIYAHIPTTANIVGPRPEGTAPHVFLGFGEVLKDLAGSGTFERMSDLRGSNRWGSTEKKMHMIGVHAESADGPGVRFTDATDFLFEKRCQFPCQNLFPLFGIPDKVIGQFVCDVFGVLRIHTPHYNKRSRF